MPENFKEFSVKVWRTNSNMTQQDVADKLGVTKQSVIRWEKDDAELKGLQLYALAKLFNTEVDYIKAKKFNINITLSDKGGN
ncbi:helix-turn-helix transcriptional regulator [Staphylococcus aureus]|nr:helix-turn-helix transcriptional regulator [Staphylococcus aureus]WRN05620.1 helix-turn-helix transcriptional regulator [Staphylococcus aureus]